MGHSIRQILKGNWPAYLRKNKVEPYQQREVEKMIACSKNSCNGRICSCCGKRYTDKWSKKLAASLLTAPHCHVVLTVPATLRPMLRDWNKLKLLMDASVSFCANISV